MVAPTPDYREAGRMLSAYGRRLGVEGDDAGAQQVLASATAIAKHEGDLALEMETLLNAAWVDLHHLRLQESGKKGLRVIELMDQLDDPLSENATLLYGIATSFLLRIHYNTSNLGEARRYATLYQEAMETLGDSGRVVSALYCNEKIAALGGDWTSARQFCERGLMNASEHLLCVRAQLEYAVGDFKQGEAFLDRAIEEYHAAGLEPEWAHVYLLQTIAAIAHMTGTTKHIDVAQAVAQTILSLQRVSPVVVWFARTALALLAIQVGDTATVQEQYQMVRGKRGALMTMDVDRLLGVLAAASGERDKAAAYFEAALATWGKGHYPEYAWAAYEYADMLFQRGHPGDQDRANHLLDEALTISRELGMVPLRERVLSRKERVNMQ